MKGLTVVHAITAVAVAIISVVIFASAHKMVDNMTKDKEYFEAKLTLLGIRDNMILASTLDSGEIKSKSFGTKGTYRITIDNEFISLAKFDDEGNAVDMPPVAPLPHYTPEAILKARNPPYVINVVASKDICILKQQEEPACGPAVEVYEAGDAGCQNAPRLCK